LDRLAAFVRWNPMLIFVPPLAPAGSPGTAPEGLRRVHRVKGEVIEILGVIHEARKWPED
jgi:hypothetical protein